MIKIRETVFIHTRFDSLNIFLFCHSLRIDTEISLRAIISNIKFYGIDMNTVTLVYISITAHHDRLVERVRVLLATMVTYRHTQELKIPGLSQKR